jgi:hypothetical protein
MSNRPPNTRNERAGNSKRSAAVERSARLLALDGLAASQMAFMNPDATFLQQADRVNTLYHRVGDIRDRSSSSETDARSVNLNNVMMTANAGMATLRLLSWAKRGGDGVLIQALGLARPEYINLVAEDLLRSSRLFLVLESQFQIETLSRNILLALGRRADKRGYYSVAKDVIATTGLADRDLKLRVLNISASPLSGMSTEHGHCRIKEYRTNYRSYTIRQSVQTTVSISSKLKLDVTSRP